MKNAIYTNYFTDSITFSISVIAILILDVNPNSINIS